VAGVRNDKGDVLVSVCDPQNFLKDSCAYDGRAKAHPGEVVVTVDGVPPGVWAVQAFHDETLAGHVRQNLLGLPLDGLGFSNDAPFRFGPPTYSDAAFRLGPGGGRIRLTLRYLL